MNRTAAQPLTTPGTSSFKDSEAICRFGSSPLGTYLQQLTDELADEGFSRTSIRRQICVGYQFGEWLSRSGIPISAVEIGHLSQFITRCSQIKQGDAKALRRIFDILARSGIVPRPERTSPNRSLDEIVDRHMEYLRREIALAPRTIEYHRRLATRFLCHRFGDDRVGLASVQARDILGFVQGEASRMAPRARRK